MYQTSGPMGKLHEMDELHMEVSRVCNNTPNVTLAECLHLQHPSLLYFFVIRASFTSMLIVAIFTTNFFLLYVLWKAKSTRKIRNECYGCYLINVCALDLLAALLCTVCSVTYQFDEICHDFNVFWRLYSGLHVMFSSGWIATIAVMIMERFLLNRDPLLKRRTFRRMKNKLSCVWVWAVSIALPQLIFYRYVNIEIHCSMEMYSHDSPYIKMYAALRMIALYVIPSWLILKSSARLLALHNTESALSLKRKKGHQKFFYFVLMLWVTFLCSNLPKNLSEVIAIFHLVPTHKIEHEQIFIYTLLASWIVYVVTPILYFFMYGKLLKAEIGRIIKTRCVARRQINKRSQKSIFRRTSLFNKQQAADDTGVDSFLAQRLVQNLGLLDGNMIENLSFDMCKEVNILNARRTSLNLKYGESSHKMLAGGDASSSRRLSLFRKTDMDENVHESRFLTSLLPSYEHSVQKLNQTNNFSNDFKKMKLRTCTSTMS